MRVIGVRYGSLTDFRFERATVSEVARQLRMPWATVSRVVKKFDANGHDLDALVAKKPRSFDCIPDSVKRLILSTEML